jgi:DNA repair exonuclease SbcCD nuclease subunit
MTKILHTADIHLDSPLRSLALRDQDLREEVQIATRSAFTKIIDTAIEENVDALLIAGDLFDGTERSARTAAFLTSQLDRLREIDIRVFYVKGNHDADNPLTGELNLPDNVCVFDGSGSKVELADNIWIHGVSFPRRQAPESLLPKFSAPVEKAINIALLHTSIGGSEGHDTYAPCSLNDLKTSGFDYWALGHIHRRQVHSKAPWVVMPGTPQGRDIGESGPKSATLLTIGETIEIKEVPTSVVEFLIAEIDITDAETDDDLRDLIKQRLHETASSLISDSGVVRLSLTGSNSRRWQIQRDNDVWKESAEQIARETGCLWLDKLVLNLSDTDQPSHNATDELAQIMETIRQEAGFTEEIHSEIQNIMAELPGQRRGELMPDESSVSKLAQQLAEKGAQRILSKMKGVPT